MDLSTCKAGSCSRTRFKHLLLLGMMFGASVVMFLVLNTNISYFIQNNHRGYVERRYSEEYQPDNLSAIRSEGCRIPLMAGADDLIRKMEASVNSMTPCTPYPLLDSNKTHIWIKKENTLLYNLSSSSKVICCYKSFYRPKSIDDITASKIDNRVKYNDCRNFSDTIEVHDEFVRVICSDKLQLFDSFFVFARKRKLKLTKNKIKLNKNLPYNILILGIDSVSRLNFHRTMPKTVKILKNLGAVELLGYNKVGDNSFPNIIPLLLGMKDTELEETCLLNRRSAFDNCPFIWERAQKVGFVTALAEDTSKGGTFNYARGGFLSTPTDYYLHTFIHQAEQHTQKKTKLCMNEKFLYKILLDYVEDLTMQKIKLFGFFWEMTMSHDKLNYPMVMDNSYSEFFNRLHSSGYLNETIIFVLSDHGMRIGKFRLTKQGFLEERLPFVMALMPPSFHNNFSEANNNLKLNSQRLSTPFDMHATLSDLINLTNIQNENINSRSNEFFSIHRGISLFLPIPGNRTCKSAAIDDHWCTCYRSKNMTSNSRTAKNATQHVVSHLNYIIKDYPQCAALKLAEILKVTRLLTGNFKESKNGSIVLTVVLQTNPGGGVFEATLGREGGPGGLWSLAGTVSRLNLYGNQSYCVPIAELKLYCYCKNQH